MEESYPMRINKYLAHKKHCTRREADELIAAGKVLVNGRIAEIGEVVDEADTVEVRFKPRTHRYFAYNKPRGIVTHSPQKGEKEIADVAGIPGVYPVGRLDKDSSGLIILTDDGRIVERLLSPESGHEKEYVVSVKEELAANFKQRMERGVEIEGYRTKENRVRIIGPKTFAITVTEGKRHQIRRMCAALGYAVEKLERIRVMNIRLSPLKSGEHRPINGAELASFLKELGLAS